MSCNCESNKEDVYVPEAAIIAVNQPMTAMENFFDIQFEGGKDLGHMPGQFVEVSIPGYGEAPISVSSSPDKTGSFEMVVRRVGRLSAAMHNLPVGARIGMRGPFGTPFPVDDVMKGRDVLFITGGIGLVPVRSAIQYVLNHRDQYGKVTILYGTKTPADRLFVDELQAWGGRDDVTYMETVDCGDDAWKGNVGVITTLMPQVDADPDKTTVVVCGPPVMISAVLRMLDQLGVERHNIFNDDFGI